MSPVRCARNYMLKALLEPIKPDEDNEGIDEDGIRDEGNQIQDDLIDNRLALLYQGSALDSV